MILLLGVRRTYVKFTPEIGDVRISYHTVNSGTLATVFGTVDANQVRPYITHNDEQFYRLMLGTKTETIAQLEKEYKRALWASRIQYFVVMLVGCAVICIVKQSGKNIRSKRSWRKIQR